MLEVYLKRGQPGKQIHCPVPVGAWSGRRRKWPPEKRSPRAGQAKLVNRGSPPAFLTPGVASQLVERGGPRGGGVTGPERRQPRPETQEWIRPRGLGCGAARARERIARGVPGPALYRLGSPGAGAPHCPLVRREGGRTPKAMDHHGARARKRPRRNSKAPARKRYFTRTKSYLMGTDNNTMRR
ncbi:hypothetical protein NDU88_005246 [Pleurodeles waltl]|uniref:Uncharacterized protein n=1 Tax=Pleurodeles waltl TaxID=8319 RepID=A0AAV7WU68_PLEWA|nr:hypothetical protein NDU88_005246 [Pleurodeles waltl]